MWLVEAKVGMHPQTSNSWVSGQTFNVGDQLGMFLTLNLNGFIFLILKIIFGVIPFFFSDSFQVLFWVA